MKYLLLLLTAACALAQNYDLLLQGARVIDPRNGIDGVMDVAIVGRNIAAVAPNIDAARAKKTIDVHGLELTPGLVDIHVHLFHTTGQQGAWAGDNSVAPDSFSFRSGVTTMVDAGSSGWRNFETFRHTVIDRAQTRVFAMINIAGLGMMTNAAEQVKSEFKPEEVVKLAAKHKDVVVGVKSAHYEAPDWTSVEKAVEAGKGANTPVMVDFGYFSRERPYYKLVTEKLRPGDISTHMYRASVPYLDENGKLYDYLKQARARGVKFDVGHGAGSLVLRNAVPAIAQGFYPDSISTDLHALSMNGPMMDMPTTMSKFLAMGMSLADVILRSTWNPAQMIHHPELGHLSVGANADIAVWKVIDGDFGYGDIAGGRIAGKRRLNCEMTLMGGNIVWDYNQRAARGYRELGPDYGLRDGVDFIVRPPAPRR
jgi:dihydroorotase